VSKISINGSDEAANASRVFSGKEFGPVLSG
jgi:hypothetical protein